MINVRFQYTFWNKLRTHLENEFEGKSATTISLTEPSYVGSGGLRRYTHEERMADN